MNKKQITVATYNKSAYELSKKFNKIGPRSEDIRRAFSFIKKDNPKVIEIGCGNGRDAKEILKFTNDYVGLDISEEMINLSKEFLPKTNFVVTDIESFDFPENIDIIFAFASLLHLNKDSVEYTLRRAWEKQNDNGIFYISVKLSPSYEEKIKTDEFGDRAFYFYSKKDFQELAKNSGYKIIYEDTQNLRGVDWLTVVLQK